MGLSDPCVLATCDNCGEEQEFGMTALARSSWDLRNIQGELESSGWVYLSDDETYCSDECQREADEEDDMDEDEES